MVNEDFPREHPDGQLANAKHLEKKIQNSRSFILYDQSGHILIKLLAGKSSELVDGWRKNVDVKTFQ